MQSRVIFIKPMVMYMRVNSDAANRVRGEAGSSSEYLTRGSDNIPTRGNDYPVTSAVRFETNVSGFANA